MRMQNIKKYMRCLVICIIVTIAFVSFAADLQNNEEKRTKLTPSELLKTAVERSVSGGRAISFNISANEFKPIEGLDITDSVPFLLDVL